MFVRIIQVLSFVNPEMGIISGIANFYEIFPSKRAFFEKKKRLYICKDKHEKKENIEHGESFDFNARRIFKQN